MRGKKILVIDDDINLCHSIQIDFARAGAIVHTATDGKAGLKIFYQHQPDLVILDIRMPVMNGWETCRNIRLVANTPIIMLTSVNQEQDMVRGLQLGADDFVTKPFSRDVLFARVQAVLRRTELAPKSQSKSFFQDSYLQIDLEQRQVLVENEPVKLTSTEFRLLSHLFENIGRTLPYQSILKQVWGWEYENEIDYVHVYMSHLRHKLEEDPRNPRYLLNEHSKKYRFASQPKLVESASA